MRRDGSILATADTRTVAAPAWARGEEWLALVASWIAARPTASHPDGLARVRDGLVARLQGLAFSVRVHAGDGVAPVVVAIREPDIGARWVGLFGHYDVEEAGDGWSSDPFAARVVDGRVYGRGVGDDLGPLALRLLALEDALGEQDAALPGLVWVIQGEEEIGSPWAHALFPEITLPPVALWLEETGYFEDDGTQRVLARRIPPDLAPVLDRLAALARNAGRGQRVLDRYLNKAFGESRCPCLTHLVRDAPYLAIGPNDTWARIHAADESLPLGTLALAAAQLVETLREVARCG